MTKPRHWVVTGASRGIGISMVIELLKSGEQVTALARNCERSEPLQKLLSEGPARLKLMELDVAKESDIEHARKALSEETIDVLVNNAGVYKDGGASVKELEVRTIEETFAVNVLAPFRVTQAFLPMLLKSERPVIANISSLMGSISENKSGGSYAYRMSKAALNMFGKNLSHDLVRGIVLSLHPGWVKTDMGGREATTERETSAAGLVQVIRGATKTQSGTFINYKGETLPW